jgi:hypothetical protein
VVGFCEHGNEPSGLTCQHLSEQTRDSYAFLNAKCFLNYVLNCEQNFVYFHPDYPTSELARVALFVRPFQPHITRWISIRFNTEVAHSQGVNQMEREALHLPPCCAKIKNAWSAWLSYTHVFMT